MTQPKPQQPKVKEFKIYALIDPRTELPFYVGATSQSIAQRKSEHVYGSRNFRNKNIKKEELIREILDNDLKVQVELLEGKIKTQQECDLAESMWIMEYQTEYNLTNVDSGSALTYTERCDIHSNYFLTSDVKKMTPVIKNEIIVKFAGEMIGKVETKMDNALQAINKLENQIIDSKNFNGFKVKLVRMFLTGDNGKPEEHFLTGLNFEFIRG